MLGLDSGRPLIKKDKASTANVADLNTTSEISTGKDLMTIIVTLPAEFSSLLEG